MPLMSGRPQGRLLPLTLLLFMLTAPAHAYTDPGAGFLALQAITATAIGAMFYFRRAVARIAAAIFRRPRDRG